MYSRVPNKRPEGKYLLKTGTLFGQIIRKGDNFFTKYNKRGSATIVNNHFLIGAQFLYFVEKMTK